MRVVHVIVNLEVGGAEIALLRLASFLRLSKLLRDRRPDVVQTWLFAADFLGGLAARLAGCRVLLWSIHSVEVSSVSSRATRLFRTLNAKLSWWVPARIVSVASAAVRSHVEFGYDPSRFVVIPNGFDLQYLQPDPGARQLQRAVLGIGADELVIGWVGRYNAAKDCETFLRAAGLLIQQHPGLRFLMVGRQIDVANVELMVAVRAVGLEGRLILSGEQRDVRPYYAAMDIFCMSSLTEAFPLVLGEAMCMGLPCIATDVGDSAMLLGEAGKIVPARSPRDLAEGLRDLVQMDAQQRAAMGEVARERAAAQFSLVASCERYQSLYRDMIQERGKH